MSKILSHLTAAVLSFGETLLAIDRAVSAGFEWDLTLFLTIGTSRLEHLPWPSAAESAATLIRHVASSLFWFELTRQPFYYFS